MFDLQQRNEMLSILKNLPLIAAVMLLGAMSASNASAATLTAGKTPGTHTATAVHAVQYGSSPTENMFVAFGNKLSCGNPVTTFTGEASGTDSSLTMTPSFNHCFKINENHTQGLPLTVSANGCHFFFNEPSAVGASTTTFKGTLDIVCPAEKVMEISVFSGGTPTGHSGFRICRDTIGAQKGIGNIEYHNVAGAPDHITVTVRAMEIVMAQHGLCGSTSSEAVEYISNLTLTSGTPTKAGVDDLWFSTGAEAQGSHFIAGDRAAGKHTESSVRADQHGSSPTENMFVAFGNKLSCQNTTTTFNGTMSGTDTSVILSASYVDCYHIGENHAQGLPVTVNMNGCDYKLNQPSAISATTYLGTIDVVCPTEKPIEVSVYSGGTVTSHSGFRICRQTIGPQKGVSGVEYHNVEVPSAPDDLTITVRSSNVKASQHGLCSVASTEVAEYISNLTLGSGTLSEAGKDDVWLSS